MKKSLIITCILIMSASGLYAQKENTKSVMQDAFYSLTQLLPMLSSEMKFSDPKNEKEIAAHIARMTVAFKKGSHQKMLNSASLKPNVEALISNLEAAEVSFNDNNKSFARMRLHESTSLCISCHTQLPQDQVMTLLTSKKDLEEKLGDNQYELGNLYFILRNYERAIAHYMNYIREKAKESSKTKGYIQDFYNKHLYSAYFNMVYITAKVLKSPVRTLEVIEEMEKRYAIPNYLKTDLVLWKSRARFWANKYPKLAEKKFTPKEIKKIIDNLESMMIIENSVILSSDYDYDLMLLSGILSNSLLAHKKVDKGTALYWLGLAEYRLGKSIFYNIGDQYLKECIIENSKKAIASKCYEAWESEVIFRNTGTSGTHIPKSVRKQLDKLKKLL